MRLLLLAILLTLSIVASSLTAHASCLVPDVGTGFDRAKAVFIGEVEEIIPPRSEEDPDFFFTLVKFRIEKSWKGLPFGWVTVRAIQGNKIAALPPFRKGERYLVYADPVFRNEVATDDLLVNGCNRTARLPRKPPRRKTFMDPPVDWEDGTRDLRALDGMMFLKRR